MGAEVQFLLEARAEPSAPMSSDGATPLLIAAQNGHTQVVNLLLEAGADKDMQRTSDGSTPVIMAVQFGQLAVLRELVEVSADLSSARADSLTPLLLACEQGFFDAVAG